MLKQPRVIQLRVCSADCGFRLEASSPGGDSNLELFAGGPTTTCPACGAPLADFEVVPHE